MTSIPDTPPVSHLGTESRNKSFDTLQVGRALAAIFVVFFHAHVFFIPERLYPGETISRVFNMGYSGVEFFFVLSGFIMVLVHRRDIGQPGRALSFLKKRFIRIVPFYWVVTLGLVSLLLVQGAESADRLSLERLVHSILLLPMPDGSALLVGAAWTLSHEFLFYLVFCILVLAPGIGAAIFILWFTIICFFSFGQTLPYPMDLLFAPYNLLFGMGMISAVVFTRIPHGLAFFASWVGTILFLAVGIADTYQFVLMTHATRTILYGLFAALAVTGLTAWEGLSSPDIPRSLVFLGDASFAIYLVHGTVLPVATKVFLMLNLSAFLPPIVSLLLLVALSILAGSLAHYFIERPLIRVLRNRANTH